MAQRNIEEVIQTIAPSRRRGVPNAPAIDVGAASGNGDLAKSLSQAGQQIAQLQSAYQQQANLVAENTQALQSNTSTKGSSAASTAGNIASNLFGGGLGLLSPWISGIESLFGGGKSTPAALPIYTPPPPVAISAVLQSPAPVSDRSLGGGTSMAQGPAVNPANQTSSAPQITVNVSAMDSQSFMDRSSDIANAVREAMLNMHSINDVVANI
jgi:hypothetical protein